MDATVHVRTGPELDATRHGFYAAAVVSGGDVPRIVVGPRSRVGGTLNFERKVLLYVSDQATIGPVQGATVVKYSGERAPD